MTKLNKFKNDLAKVTLNESKDIDDIYPKPNMRKNPRRTGPDNVNHVFDTEKIIDVGDGWTIKLTQAWWYREPGAPGYDADYQTKKNPFPAEKMGELINPKGKVKSKKSDVRTSSGYYDDQIIKILLKKKK
jgi:hypothetical protein